MNIKAYYTCPYKRILLKFMAPGKAQDVNSILDYCKSSDCNGQDDHSQEAFRRFVYLLAYSGIDSTDTNT